jgi:hypothetical protein
MNDECGMMNGCWVLGSGFVFHQHPEPNTQHPPFIHHSSFRIHHF